MPNIHRLLEVFRADHLRVVYLTLGPVLADGSDLSPTFRWRYRLEEQSLGFRVTYPLGTPGHRILDEIAPRPDELVINKTANSAFNASDNRQSAAESRGSDADRGASSSRTPVLRWTNAHTMRRCSPSPSGLVRWRPRAR